MVCPLLLSLFLTLIQHQNKAKTHKNMKTHNLNMPRFLVSLCLLESILIISCVFQANGLTSPSEVSALKAFKASIQESSIQPWTCLGSWDFKTDPCAIPRRTHFICGLTCSPDGSHVTQITLDPAGYKGTLTQLISKLTYLITLDLTDNFFTGTIPSSISSLTNLKFLNLQANKFTGSIPASLNALRNLETLDLSRNSLSGTLPGNLKSLLSLTRLDLSSNRLSGFMPKLPANLVVLAMKGNSLSGVLSKSSFEGSNKIVVIELAENSFTGTLQSWFFDMPSLQQVDLSNNSFTGIEILKAGDINSELIAVELSFNKIDGYLPVDFANFPLLSSLSLRYNKLHGEIPLVFSNKKSLKRLFLDGNYFTGKVPAAFFLSGSSVTGSLGDNCLEGCPASSELCMPSQKPSSICKQAYKGKPRS